MGRIYTKVLVDTIVQYIHLGASGLMTSVNAGLIPINAAHETDPHTSERFTEFHQRGDVPWSRKHQLERTRNRGIYNNHSFSSNHESRPGDRGWSRFKIVKLQIPDPGPGQVRIKVRARGARHDIAIIVEGRRAEIRSTSWAQSKH